MEGELVPHCCGARASNEGRQKRLTSSMLLGKTRASLLANAADMSAHFPAALQDPVQLIHAPHVVAKCTSTRGMHACNQKHTDHASCCLVSSLAAALHLCCVHCSGGMVSVGPALGVGHMAAVDGLAQPTLHVSAAAPSCSRTSCCAHLCVWCTSASRHWYWCDSRPFGMHLAVALAWAHKIRQLHHTLRCAETC